MHRTCARSQRGVVVLPGLGNSYRDYIDMAALLEAKGLLVEVAQVARADWFRNAAGLRNPAYWKGTLQPRPTVDWYLHKVRCSLALLPGTPGRQRAGTRQGMHV